MEIISFRRPSSHVNQAGLYIGRIVSVRLWAHGRECETDPYPANLTQPESALILILQMRG